MKRAALSLLLLSGCGGAPQVGGARPPETERAATMVDLPEAERAFDDASKALAAAGSDCVQMCKALESMARATERLCELAGPGADAPRCADAKSKLDSARAKVKATCGGACE